MITGDRTVEIDAPADDVYAMIVDAEEFPSWNPSAKEVEVTSTNGSGLPATSRVLLDVKVKTVKLNLGYVYGSDPRSMRFESEKGSEVKKVECDFVVTDSGPASCAVRMTVVVDPGRTLGLLLRGPVVDKVRDHIIDGTLSKLKERAEG